ncbi:hypothetical protein MYAM1_001329 [Malassezia yamatoensis]|uniref:Uncharacterized protein n=1 Tax=Malassezia yamatoensis TaxID=253288 RepID=A0AAJ5YQH7_9BASI|nr:hypothetical protein MYAM1_001329 [Malassezia yamatoensis]
MSRQPEVNEIPEHVVKYSARLHEPIFKKRDAVLEKIDKFWPQALVNCVSTNVYIDDDDHALLDSVTKINVERDVNDPRAASIHFHFAPNDFIEDKVLVKEFPLDPKAGEFSSQFDFASETIPQPTKIQWKSDEKNLSKLKPTVGDLVEGKEDDEEDIDFEPGSFFSSFFDSESRQVAGSIGRAIVEDLYPNAVQHYENPSLYEDEEDDDEDEDDEEDEDDDDREIDLEEEESRPKKKTRK